MRFGAARTAGRLIEIWVSALVNELDVLAVGQAVRAACSGLTRKPIACVDCRGVMSQSPEVLSTWIEMLRSVSGRFERSAILVPTGEGLALSQIHTVLSRAEHPARKVCTNIVQAVTWLEPVMSADEKIRLRQFLASR